MAKMKTNSLKLFFLFTTIIIPINHARNVKPPKQVEIISDYSGANISIRLNKVDPYLANGNLPVYIIREHDPNNLDQFNQIMDAVGGFSMYQNPEASSAAVLFEKENKFDGIIGMEYIINRVDYIPGKNVLRTSHETLLPQIKARFPFPKKNPFLRTKRGFFLANENNETEEICVLNRDVSYIEILVMVDNSMIRSNILTSTSPDDYTPVVSHVLTLFNNVDMLYAKINKPRIQINIAGIIIGERPETFAFLDENKCVEMMEAVMKNGNMTVVRSLDAQCTSEAVGSYLFQFRKNYEFRNSFDNVILLTGLPIHKYSTISKDEAAYLKGFRGEVELRNEEEKDSMTVRVGATIGERYFANYVAIAHELGHAFSIEDHDTTPITDASGNCCAFIMRPDNDYCKNCIAWSPTSQRQLQKYFQSSASCIYMNKPKSLRSGPHKLTDAKRQCSCYGYKLLKKRLCVTFNLHPPDFCRKPLQCADKTGENVRLNYPMDGTACGLGKVCWGRECRRTVY